MCSFCSEIDFMTASVNSSQPLCWCEPAWLARTVRVAFSRSTPCLAQLSRLPVLGMGIFKSSAISLKIFCRDGGRGTSLFTEKHSPLACFGP